MKTNLSEPASNFTFSVPDELQRTLESAGSDPAPGSAGGAEATASEATNGAEPLALDVGVVDSPAAEEARRTMLARLLGGERAPEGDPAETNGGVAAAVGEGGPAERVAPEGAAEQASVSRHDDDGAKPKRSKFAPKGRRTKKVRMATAHKEICDVEGAALVLGVSKWLVLRLAKEGKLPGRKLGREWRFRTSELVRWVGEPEGESGEPKWLRGAIESGKASLSTKGEKP